MTKESAQPKAVNIIRPLQTLAVSRPSSIVSRSSYTSQSSSNEPRKFRVATSAKLNLHEPSTASKPHINIYHPPSQRQPFHIHRPQDEYRPPTTKTTHEESRQPPSLYRTPPDEDTRHRSLAPQAHKRDTDKAFQRSHGGNDIYKPTKRTIASTSLSRSFTTPALSAHTQQQQQHQQQINQTTYVRHILPPRPTVITKLFPSADEEVDPNSSDITDEEQEENASDVDSRHQSDDDNDEVNDARVNRKIADLEISNRSLLAINDMLEITVRKQASQVAKLKKQIGQSPNLIQEITPIDVTEHGDVSDDEWENDEVFRRLCQMTEKLIEECKASLEFEYKGSGKVITRYSEDEDTEKESTDTHIVADQTEEQPTATTQAVPNSNLSNDKPSVSSHTQERRMYHSDSITWQPRGSRDSFY